MIRKFGVVTIEFVDERSVRENGIDVYEIICPLFTLLRCVYRESNLTVWIQERVVGRSAGSSPLARGSGLHSLLNLRPRNNKQRGVMSRLNYLKKLITLHLQNSLA